MPEPVIAKNVSKLKEELRDGLKGLLPLLGLIVYTVLGALLFRELEYHNEKFTLEELQKDRAKIVEDTIYSLNTKPRGPAIDTYNNTKRILMKYNEKLGIDEIDPDHQVRWSFWGAVYYCITVYTTIGYGNITPVTTGGRILTIIYAFLGIPLALIVLYSLGLIFARICRWIWKAMIHSTKVVSKDLGKKVENAVGLESGQTKTTESDDDDLLSFPISFLIFVTIIWIFICALVFLIFEDWDYGTSLYFTLISFTTIGFGDIVPSEFSYVIVLAILLLIGLSLVSTMLTLIQQQIQALASGMQANIDREYMNALAEAEDEGEISAEDARRMSSGEGLKNGEHGNEDQQTKKTIDSVIARMPLKERVLYHIMPASAKKAIQENADSKSQRKNKGCQTDMFLLEDLIKEELLKYELKHQDRPGKVILPTSSNYMTGPPPSPGHVYTQAPTQSYSPAPPQSQSPAQTQSYSPVQTHSYSPVPIASSSSSGPSSIPVEYEKVVEPEDSSKPSTPAHTASTSFVMPTRTVRLHREETEEEEADDTPRVPTRSFKIEKVTPIEQPTEPSTITTTTIQEDEV